jgi:hypothetical protein
VRYQLSDAQQREDVSAKSAKEAWQFARVALRTGAGRIRENVYSGTLRRVGGDGGDESR